MSEGVLGFKSMSLPIFLCIEFKFWLQRSRFPGFLRALVDVGGLRASEGRYPLL